MSSRFSRRRSLLKSPLVASVAVGIGLIAPISGAVQVQAAPNDEVLIADEVLLAAINKQLDENRPPNAPVSEAEAQGLTQLIAQGSVANGYVESLSGLEYFENLNKLDIRFQRFPESDLEIIGSLESLKDLNVGGSPTGLYLTPASDFSFLENLRDLEKLYLHHNGISDLTGLVDALNVAGSVSFIHLQSNDIEDVSPLAQLSSLESITLHHNKISDISPLKPLSGLKSIWAGGNNISDISVLKEFANTNFEALDFWEQEIHLPVTDVISATANPVLNVEGNFVPVTSSDPGFTLGVASHNWVFTEPGQKTLQWDQPFDGDDFGWTAKGVAFDGTIKQSVTLAQAQLDEPQITPPVCKEERATPPYVDIDDSDGVSYSSLTREGLDGNWTITVTAELADGYEVQDLGGWEDDADEDAYVGTTAGGSPDCRVDGDNGEERGDGGGGGTGDQRGE